MDDSSNPYATPASEVVPRTDIITNHMADVEYPLQLSFKILALANKTTLIDSKGQTVFFTKQKLLKFREHVQIFTDNTQQTLLAEIRANKVIDWSARYDSTDASGAPLGSVGRKGWRSIFKAHYDVFPPESGDEQFSITEDNAMTKVFDSVLGQIPIVGLLTSYLFHPSYTAKRADGTPVMRLTKKAALWEGKFQIELLAHLEERDQLNLILSYLMMVNLERSRG